MKTIAVLRSNPKDAALTRLVRSLSRIAEIECLVWDRQGDFEPATKSERIRYVKCGLRAGFYSARTLLKLIVFQAWLFLKLLTGRCDAIHAIDLDTGLPGLLAARLRGKKFVYHCLDPYYAILPAGWPRFLAAWARRLEDRLISEADLFVITDLLRMPQHEGAKPRRVVEVANVPFLPPITPPAPTRSSVFTVGYLGSLIEGRNLLTAVDACGELADEGVRLVIGGFGPLERVVEVKARAWPNVTFQPWTPYEKMLEEEASFDLFFHLTDPASESQKWVSPNKLFEAMAFGRPIVVAEGTLAARRVESFGNGLVVPYGSKEALKTAVLRLKSDPQLANDMGARGQAEFQRNWRPEEMERRLLKAYAAILEIEV
ncbi:MAG: glycosyltransferase family 4 protein [Deltaproteobacteria bacterium]|nr:glycosyltransferase family 4 protein [Deltaproteobacteria bacterium]